MEITRVGDFVTTWGESLVWDEQRQRLYFVDTLESKLHWLDAGETTPHELVCPQMPSGMVADAAGRLVVTMHDGIYRIDVDAATFEKLFDYPDRLGGRCNDMCADSVGNLITGKLNLGPDEGSSWRVTPAGEWLMLDDDISNTNGPTVAELDGQTTLIIGDSSKQYYRYDYDPVLGGVGDRSVFGDVDALGPSPDKRGIPDGATLDSEGGLWCALPGSSRLVRFTTKGLDGEIALPCEHPTDVTYGGPNLDVLYVVAINDGLYAIEGAGRGRVEPRFAG